MTCATSEFTTLASAPGKVLIVGGYLVLDRKHTGLVVGTDSCLYAAVQNQALDVSNSAFTFGDADIPIVVLSPQFESAWWKYSFNLKTSVLTQYESANQGRNGFVQVVLQTTLALINARVPEALQSLSSTHVPSTHRTGLKIILAADNDFYSQREALEKLGLDLTSQSLRQIPVMAKTGKTLDMVHKTGLGSSAAMVTSLVASLLAHFGVVSKTDIATGKDRSSVPLHSLQLIHNIAQYAHCLAQGKVGSGFDVSAAVYGSHLYRRFSPAVLGGVMAENSTTMELVQATSPENPGWDSDVQPVAIPPRLTLRLADVDAGSNTPSMVKKVLQWQRSNSEHAAALWTSLDNANNAISQIWSELAAAHAHDKIEYDRAIDWCAQRPSSEWSKELDVSSSPTRALLANLAAGILRVRQLQRELGEHAQVPIEPPKQTRLLDACMTVPGVCMAAVPGAGGYDAIFCMVLSPEAGDAVERLWSKWTEMSVGPLLAKQASGGVSILNHDCYPNLKALL
ncbi:phosphomevalonate kinase [Coemansia sp. RSA 989]|nr:Phosphomevalonate kinase [Coemansia mojavensis]KAJ1742752.1 phosphomevalonate kinase [Coemansia sp. RSA 1086]KAJ1751363.1 phosphomevalonate kinase [Coemansia sp. RSA 1821]KAJ1865845.1 phosphomevalonate kinase [Coemansia sp. RSA 989]KAJ1873097.1 phosphomevalonate kinase [Coemansia sp. RSA 990]KAJ2669872.1 phosphomevalonate kinase [Coemansia sp. RSA 1085]